MCSNLNNTSHDLKRIASLSCLQCLTNDMKNLSSHNKHALLNLLVCPAVHCHSIQQNRLHLPQKSNQLSHICKSVTFQIASAQFQHGTWGIALWGWVVHFALRSIYPHLQGRTSEKLARTHWSTRSYIPEDVNINMLTPSASQVSYQWSQEHATDGAWYWGSLHTRHHVFFPPPSREERASHVMWPSITSPSPLRLKQTCQESQTQYHPQGYGLSRLTGKGLSLGPPSHQETEEEGRWRSI
jgi:hypothetical protein